MKTSSRLILTLALVSMVAWTSSCSSEGENSAQTNGIIIDNGNDQTSTLECGDAQIVVANTCCDISDVVNGTCIPQSNPVEPTVDGCVIVNIDNENYSTSDSDKVKVSVADDDANELDIKVKAENICIELQGSHQGQVRIKNGNHYNTTLVLNQITITPASESNNGLRLNAGDISGFDDEDPYDPFVYTVKLVGENTITGGGDANSKKVINCQGNMTIVGDGTLNVNAAFKTGIRVDDVFRIESGTVNVNLSRSSASLLDPDDGATSQKGFAVKVGNGFEMTGGTLNIQAVDSATQQTGYEARGLKVDGMDYAYGDGKGYIAITGGNITIVSDAKGMYAGWESSGCSVCSDYTSCDDCDKGDCVTAAKAAGLCDDNQCASVCNGSPSADVVISGGTIQITTKLEPVSSQDNMGGGPGGRPSGHSSSSDQSSTRSPEGIEAKNNLTILGGHLFISATDDALNSGNEMRIGDESTGTGPVLVAISSGNDGIDSNGNMFLNGGLIAGLGTRSPECGIDVNTENNKSITFNGGTVIGIGGSESDVPKTFNAGAYVKPSIASIAGKTLALANGNELITAIQIPSSYTSGASMYILSDRLSSGQSYTFYSQADVSLASGSQWFANVLLEDSGIVSGSGATVTASTSSSGGMRW